MTRTDTHLIIHCVYKSTHLWQLTGTRPLLQLDEKLGKVPFSFPRTAEREQAVSAHLGGCPSPNLKEYVTMFKILRAEMYLTKGDQR